jgi:pyridoxamine 5'-phosphate oxidase-like protein
VAEGTFKTAHRAVLGRTRAAAPACRSPAMPSWSDVETEAPEFAALARGFLDAHTHKTLATLRRDGAPRISGTEIEFADGELWLGSMWRSLKALDLRRDPRFALHSGSADPPDWTGDAKLSGRAEEVTDPERKAAIIGDAPPDPFHLFRAELTELVVVRLGDPADHLVIETWHAERGITRRERR